MKNVSTLDKNRQDAKTIDKGTNRSPPLDAPYSSTRETERRAGWSFSASPVQPVEEDMNDPDLAMSYSGGHGYMLQPG